MRKGISNRILAVAAACMLLLPVLAGCGAGGPVANTQATEAQAANTQAQATVEQGTGAAAATEAEIPVSAEDMLTGSFGAVCNMTGLLNQELESQGISFKTKIRARFTLELLPGGTFSLDVDGTGFANALRKALVKEAPDIIKSKLSGKEDITDEQYDAMAKESGYKNFETFLKDMTREMADSFDDAFAKDLAAKEHLEGTYTQSGNTLQFLPDKEGMIKDNSAVLNDDGTITLCLILADDSEQELSFEIAEEQASEESSAQEETAAEPAVLTAK